MQTAFNVSDEPYYPFLYLFDLCELLWEMGRGREGLRISCSTPDAGTWIFIHCIISSVFHKLHFIFLVLTYGITFFFFVYSFVLTGVCLGNMYSKNWNGRIGVYFIMFSIVCTGFGCICLTCSPLQGNAGVRCWTKLSQADFGARDDTIEACSCCIWVSVT